MGELFLIFGKLNMELPLHKSAVAHKCYCLHQINFLQYKSFLFVLILKKITFSNNFDKKFCS